jgi:hypothetical protein
MATRMQQRRGTAAQWTAANPTLAAGEIGFETDTNKFKVGNGSSAWTSLAYFVDASIVFDSSEVQGLVDAAVASLVGDAPNALNSIWELANALNGDANYAYTVTQNLLSLGNSVALNTNSISELTSNAIYLTGNVSAHTTANTSVHGISNTLNLVYNDNAALTNERTPVNLSVTEGKIANSAVTTSKIADDAVTGDKIADNAISQSHLGDNSVGTNEIGGLAVTTEKLANAAVTTEKIANGAVTKTMVGLENADNTSDASKPVSTATQTALDLKANLSGATFTGSVEIDQNLTVDGNFIVNGSNVLVSATQIQIEDTLLQLGHTNANNITDLGLVVGYNDGAAKHAGIVKDVTDGKWKLFKDLTVEPATTVDFTSASLDTLSVGALESANAITATGGVAFSDGTQTKEGVPSRTPIISKTASYTLTATSERDSLIEVDSASGTTITIPLNSAVAYPVGTTLDILQTGTGQVTIAGDSGVTVNSTPGLKLRTQWSSCTLFKRATDSWVVFGDLSA